MGIRVTSDQVAIVTGLLEGDVGGDGPPDNGAEQIICWSSLTRTRTCRCTCHRRIPDQYRFGLGGERCLSSRTARRAFGALD